jgi:putative ABC transport system ATP-binding protein
VTQDPPAGGPPAVADARVEARLRVEHLGFSAGTGEEAVRILDDVSFSVPRGTLFTVIGPSGSGKSTLLRCINRLVEPDAGEVLLDGAPASGLPVQELHRRVGMVFQTAALFEGTVLDNVLYGPRLATCGRHGPEGLAGKPPRPGEAGQAAALLERVGLPPEFLARAAGEPSGGEAQRVSIARALANDPEVLLLDEPTSALDPTASLVIQELLQHLADEGDLTLVFVTHDPAQARKLGDHGLLLVEGRVLDGSPLPAFLDQPASEETRAFVEGRFRNGSDANGRAKPTDGAPPGGSGPAGGAAPADASATGESGPSPEGGSP